MRELAVTGFMSNRSRQNVASFLTKVAEWGEGLEAKSCRGKSTLFFTQDLLLDWRLGAEWFESLLLDHDVASNYGQRG